MPLTHDFKETNRARAHTDPKFRQGLEEKTANATIFRPAARTKMPCVQVI